MNTLKGLNDAIEYIESNLCGEIDWHESPDTLSPNYKSEIWIPVLNA